jgi:hypothetical protein
MTMSKTPFDGGPAFPCPETSTSGAWDGQTLLDHFAGQAMIGMLSNPSIFQVVDDVAKKQGLKPGDVLAVMSYAQAKAMVKEKARVEKEHKE